MSSDDVQKAVDRVRRLAEKRGLKEVTLSTSYSKPSLKVRDKALVTIKAADTMVLSCPLEVKEMLIEMAPDIYYQTDHYKGWPGLLVRLDVIGDEELGLRIADAWQFKAPKKLRESDA